MLINLIVLEGYLDADVKSRILSNPDRLGYRNIPSIPKALENKIANNNSNSNNKEKEKTPAINVRLDALIQELHLRKNGENAGELSEEALHRAKAPLKKLAADVCQLIRGNDSNELLGWKQLGSTNRLFYSLVFEDIAAAHVELGNLYQCCERWGANGFLSLAFKAVKQKHNRKEERNRTIINVMYTTIMDKSIDTAMLIFLYEKYSQILLLVMVQLITLVVLFLPRRVTTLKMTTSQ